MRNEAVKYRLGTGQQGVGLVAEGHEDVHVEGGDWFEMEGGSHCTADGIMFDHASGLHLVNRGDDLGDVHGRRRSSG
ncbi:MAG: hypothetical protein SH807_04215 [Blastochloris sp.]|nr:hypothetical protein [Blastochloris sp.]